MKFLVVKPKVMMRERVGLWDSRRTEQLTFMKLAGGKNSTKTKNTTHSHARESSSEVKGKSDIVSKS